MLTDKIKQFISINVTGHVFMFCTKEGIKNSRQIRQYEKRARDYLEQKANDGADIREIEKELKIFLENLREELHDAIEVVEDRQETTGTSKTASESKPSETPEPEESMLQVEDEPVPEPEPEQAKPEVAYSDAMFAEEEAKLKAEEEKLKEEQAKKKAEREQARKEREKANKKSGAKPQQQTARMEEKLAIQRKPIQELLTKECVDFKLMTPERAKHWAHNLSGRRIEDVEIEIVDELRQKLSDNVKSYLRKNKKSKENPWPSPALQEELRMEISLVKTIKGMLMLTSNVLWEIRNAKESGRVSLFNRIKKKISG